MRTNEDDKKIEKQTNLDRHGLRPIANVCPQAADPLPPSATCSEDR
jgi:hypothetical protein